MTDHNKNANTEKDKAVPEDSALQGRVDNTGNEQLKREEQGADISHIDRQEGTMNHGEVGGNVKEE